MVYSAPSITIQKEKSYIEEIETDYSLILHDDIFHTIDEVKDIIAKVIRNVRRHLVSDFCISYDLSSSTYHYVHLQPISK